MHLLKRVIPVVAASAVLLMTLGVTGANAKIYQNSHLAGYVALQSKKGTVAYWKEVQATFKVPALKCPTSSNPSAYQFVALGGYRSPPMQAAGVTENCSDGTASYEGAYWYSYCYDNYAYYCGQGTNDYVAGPYGPNDELSVNAGDTVSASVYSNYSTGAVVFLVSDKTTGTYWESDYTGDGYQQYEYYNSAGVFSYGNIANAGTADFGSVSFSGIEVIATNTSGTGNKRVPLDNSAWKAQGLKQMGPVTDQPDIVPGALSGTKTSSSFTNTWERAN